jgi:hypothetical protein
MKYLSFLLCASLSLASLRSQAQQVLILQNSKGDLVLQSEYVDIQGSPYYAPDWLKGSITLENAKTYQDVDLKYDEMKDKVYVKSAAGETILLNDKVKAFTIPAIANVAVRQFRSGFSGIPDASADSYFEVLAEGKTQLLKRTTKSILENKEYNSASSTKTFIENVKYYLLRDGKATLIKKDKKSVLSALKDKETALESYIKEKSLNLKSDADLALLIDYSNTI